MSKIKLTGDSSGYVEISAPSAAGNNTLELPASGSKIVVSDGSDNINVAGVVTASSLYTTSINDLNYPTAGPLSNRNLIINGAMQVAQRQTSLTLTTNTFAYPCVDRWKFELGSQVSPNYTYSQDGDAPVGFTSSFKITNNSPASQGSSGTLYNLVGQLVEQNAIDHLDWGTSDAKPITISFWIKSNVTGNDVVELVIRRNGTLSNDSIAGQIVINSADTWEYKTITFPGTTTNIGRPDYNALGFGMYFSFQGLVGGAKISSYNTWDNNNRLGGPAGDTNVFASTSGAYMNITGVQLEVGERATPFEHISYGDELLRCQRYYYKRKGNGSAAYCRFGLGMGFNGTSANFLFYHPTEMRIPPSVEDSGVGTIQTSDMYSGTPSNAALALVGNTNGTTQSCVVITVSSGLTQFRPYFIEGANNVNAYIAFNSDF